MNFLRHHILIMALAVLAAIGITGYAIWGISKPSNFAGTAVVRMPLEEEVRGSGNVKAAQAVDLSFPQVGRIARINVQVGDKVATGQTLASLDAADLAAQVLQAEADVKTQQAKLDDLKNGARPEDVAASKIKIQNAQTALDETNLAAGNALRDAYTKADDSVRNHADQFFVNPGLTPVLGLVVTDSQLEINLESTRAAIEQTLSNWKNSLNNLNSQNTNSALATGKTNLAQIKIFFDALAGAVNNPDTFIKTSGLSIPISSALKSDFAVARLAVNGAITSVTTAEQTVKTAEANLASARQDLIIKQSGATADQITAQEAQFERSQAILALAQAQYEKTVLSAPMSSVVSRVDGKLGAVASPGMAVVSLISDAKYQIEVYVSETDVAKIKTGERANVTLDAYGSGQIFDALVIKIDPAATSVNGVNSYKTTLEFSRNDNRIKAGMNANINIETAARENVIAVPQSAIITKGSDKYVIVESGSQTEERKVETGIAGSNGYVEVISGLSEGDRIAEFGGTQK